MHSVRLSGLMSVSWASAGVCESVLLTCAVFRSASQIRCHGCWIVDYISSVGHTPLESVCRRRLGSAITDLVITSHGPHAGSTAPRRLPARRCATRCRA
mmetsp:Transcript_41120/g.136849  ORF Transcript_41120/g.136849 Transcript_41120/m.136849 type:complete len:99 (-) Transcript_41120:21-317(-)